MARFLLFLLGVVALAAGAAGAYLGGAEHEKIVDRHASERLSASVRLLPVALATDAELEVVREVAQRTPFQFTLADFALQGEAPNAVVLERAERAVRSLAEGNAAVIVGTRGGIRGVSDGEAVELEEGALALVRTALDGKEAEGFVSVGGKLFRLRAVPVGAGALAVGLPVNDAFARKLGTVLGTDITFLHRGKAVASTLETIERAEFAVASLEGDELFGAGSRPASYKVFEILELPLFAPWKGTMRGTSSPSGEATVIHSIAVQPLIDPLVELEKRTLLFSALVGVLALFFALVGGGGKRRMRQIAMIADLAERAAEGDAKAQAPEHLAGDLGRLSRALNRLSKGRRGEAGVAPAAPELDEAGEEQSNADFAAAFSFPDEPLTGTLVAPPPLPAQESAQEEAPEEAPTQGLAFLEEPEPTTSLGASDEPSGPTAFGEEPPGFSTFGAEEESAPTETAAAAPPEGFEASPLASLAGPESSEGGAFSMGHPDGGEGAEGESEPWDMPTRPLPFLTQQSEPAAPEPPPLAPPTPEPPAAEPAPEPPALAAAPSPEPPAPAAEPPAFASAVPPAAEEDPEEAHLREVYEQFLEVRQQCGESSAGISYDRFTAKLRANRAQLMEKYRCIDVRFTVYVKDGRAALKASPVGMNQAV